MRGSGLGILLAGALPALAQPAEAPGPKSVDNGIHRFVASRYALKADGRTLFDLSGLASAQRAPGAFSIRILSAVGPVVSVAVRSRSCNDETCHGKTAVEAWQGKGGEAALPSIVTGDSLLAALHRDPTLAALLARPANREARRRFERARTTKEMAELLTFTGLQGPDGEVGLPSVRYDSFVIRGYDLERNLMRVGLSLEVRKGGETRPGPVLPLEVTPTRAFASYLALPGGQGLGFFAERDETGAR